MPDNQAFSSLHYHDRYCMCTRPDGSVYCVKEEPNLQVTNASSNRPGWVGEMREKTHPPLFLETERERVIYRVAYAEGQQFERNRVAVERDALSSHWSSR